MNTGNKVKKSKKLKILFACTGNSCRSQMAEGFAKNILGEHCEVYSAGVEAHGLNPKAVETMKEVGIDISDQYSKTIDKVPWQDMDIIITLCGHAAETCPAVPSQANRIHWGITDPVKSTGSESEINKVFQQVRDDIKARILDLKKTLTSSKKNHSN
ncbi:MAG: arsenate reductase (thioredoxin) [Candidatus Schekmanbacteria bacterium RBG_13_48_7]|uniref:Arsenate reductase (Thioredoxin) n=1 Tax=Candidatus Schekmanbacteria bacterium RBG_13_48_7 TaxID=1817878 RepID=A0A1F7RPP5_9BACT|nr:MAG: arsenate reductase (thioredoxin) [Candidatus Schekmanbacteria bacterium RBG_13_48_7]